MLKSGVPQGSILGPLLRITDNNTLEKSSLSNPTQSKKNTRDNYPGYILPTDLWLSNIGLLQIFSELYRNPKIKELTLTLTLIWDKC